MEHHFNIELATKLGIEEAIFLNNLYYWLHRNAANGKNFIDGSYWTYNTKQSYSELFPYMSYSKIKRIIDTLQTDCIIKTGNFNENKMDRTLWYAFTDCGLKIMQKAGYDVDILYWGKPSESKIENALVQNEPMEESEMSQCNTNINNTNINNKENKDKSLSKKKKKYEYTAEQEQAFNQWCIDNVPNLVSIKKTLTYEKFIELQASGFTREAIMNKMLYANARADFKRKYCDVYGVIKNWLSSDADPNYTQKFKSKKNKEVKV